MKIIIVSGGTGGHIYPGIAVADEIRKRAPQAEILFIGSREGLERELVPKAGYAIKFISARAFIRKLSYKSITAPIAAFWGFMQSLIILKSFQPKLLLATGGYASLPVIMAAKIVGVPIYILEQNVLPGITNRFFFRFARQTFLSFSESLRFVSGKVVGNPVRREIIEREREKARADLGYSDGDRLVLVMGGSQGARKINQALIEALPLINDSKVKILHIVGRRDAVLVERLLAQKHYSFYRKLDYVYNIEDILAASDLVVSRAGATAIAEFLVKGIPMVLVPFPFSAEGHQDINAKVVAEAGAARIISNEELTPEKLLAVFNLEEEALSKMKANCKKLALPDAAKEIVNAVL